MAVYAIGDIQGCFDELEELLDVISFDAGRDTLWFTGDLVNRGPKSLKVVRFVKHLGQHAVTVLGNHDLHLLAVTQGHKQYHRKDTFDDVLAAPDRAELVDWLRQRPLLHHDAALGITLIHAGLPPQWDLELAMACAGEVEAALRGADYSAYLEHMYGNEPECWSENLTGQDRLRFITNCFTRLRFCDVQGNLALEEKGPPDNAPTDYYPWFAVPGRRSADLNIAFGHWSTLGPRNDKGIYPLDTGCLWGGSLTALQLDCEPKKWFSVSCSVPAKTTAAK
ncbi:MAG: symmetrical bis(5'-nucleosyl)-tetraphosphatase [Gammaproteobacteria bacterium]